MEKMELVIKTFQGFEELLAIECQDLGLEEVVIANRAVSCSGDVNAMMRLNYCSRLAVKVLWKVGSFEAASQDQLYRGAYHLTWEDWLEPNQTFAVEAQANQSEFANTMFVALKVKDAIADRMRFKFDKRPDVNKENPFLRVVVHIYKQQATILLDTSGTPLFKRGYKTKSYSASLNEVLAAGIIQLSNWDITKPFYDPFCGSATLLAEASLLSRKVPAGYYRNGFAFQRWPLCNKSTWMEVVDDANAKMTDAPAALFGSDNSDVALQIARETLEEIGCAEEVELKKADAVSAPPPIQKSGWIVTNPPYGERLKPADLNALYASFGTHLKHQFTGWEAWMLSGNPEASKHIGLKPFLKFNLDNGGIESKLLGFRLFKGDYKTNRSEA
jgi:putative N6-adenine-specific DNA methylase